MDADDKIIYQNYPATKNKWYADIPLRMISNDFEDVTLKLQSFVIPRIFIGTTSLHYKGVEMKVPSKTFNPSNKTLRFTYLIDAKWESYLRLYQWANCFASIDNPTPFDQVKQNKLTDAWWNIPIHVYLLDEFKKTVMNMVFYGCIIEEFGELDVSYKDNPDVMSHSFTVSYQRMEIAHKNPLERGEGNA